MRRFLTFTFGLLVTALLSGATLWAAPRGAGGGGGGGGFSGGARGGGSGGGGVRSGGGFSGGMRAPSMGGSFRSMPGASLGGSRSGSSMGGVRISPGLGTGRPPGSSIGSAPGRSGATRIPSANSGIVHPSIGSAPRLSDSNGGPSAGPGIVRPKVGPAIGERSTSTGGARLRGGLDGELPGTVRLGGTTRSGATIGGRAPNAGSQTRLRPNLETRGRDRGAGIISGGHQDRGIPRAPVAGRMTPREVGNFLSLPQRGGDRLTSTSSGLRSSRALDVSRTAANNFRNLPVSQLNRIQTNVNNSFRKTSVVNVNVNNGFGFGFGGNPYWNNWARGVHGFCNFNRFNWCFSNRFWATNFCHFPWRRSYYWWGGGLPWSYWWDCPTWGGINAWFPSYGWSTPYYYGYGPGGNIVFDSGYVYLNDEPIATAEEYAASAAKLAEAPTPTNPDQPTEWLPLGTFTLSEGEHDKDPSRVMQLAVDKDGNISGVMTNQKTVQTFPVQGRVDKETQRVAFTIGDDKAVVFETGIYNLTQQQTPLLAHGEGRVETYLLVRLDPPQTDETAPPAAPAADEPKSLVP